MATDWFSVFMRTWCQAVEGDGLVVGVSDAASDVDERVAPHCGPVPAPGLGFLQEEGPVGGGGQRPASHVGDVDGLPAGPEAVLAEMRLAPPPSRQGLVAEDELRVDPQRGRGHEEPFPLATEGVVLASVPGPRVDVLEGLDLPDGRRLEGLLGGDHGPHGGGLRDRGDEPVALVVAAEELGLGLALADEEQQVSVAGLDVEHLDPRLRAVAASDFEELALAVGEDIQADGPGVASGGIGVALEAGTDLHKFRFKMFVVEHGGGLRPLGFWTGRHRAFRGGSRGGRHGQALGGKGPGQATAKA